MKSKLLHESDGQRIFAVVLASGEEACESLVAFARDSGIGAASVRAIGALRRATVAFYDPDIGEYAPNRIDEQVELLALSGDIALDDDDQPRLHLHAALAKRDGSAWGGHLVEAEVRPTLEAIVTESPPPLRRRIDPESGLALLDL
ncbi:MAG TPA: PPC domain-containing DNA-binding protein [Solirubrobacterales bacterium]|nr:PPC domain-containing DNA-binding protein [Solirubrobacterales bacterium]